MEKLRDSEEHDGSSALTLNLDDEGSTVVYCPSFGLSQATIVELEAALAASVASAEQPPDEHTGSSGRRQWFGSPPDRPLGWPGPRRWRRASWKLEGKEQLRPVYFIREAVEAAVAAIESMPPTEGDPPRPRLRERYNSVLVNRYPNGDASIKWHADDEVNAC